MRQAPLFETRASLAALRVLDHRPPPEAVYMGIGVCSPERMSRALPLDALGMLLSTELVRRATGARQTWVLVADAHALDSGFDQPSVAPQARAWLELLSRMRARLGWSHLHIVLASRLDESVRYRRLHRQVQLVAGTAMPPYVAREVADTAFFDLACGGILKVGWAIGSRSTRFGLDERGFDDCFRRTIGDRVPFVYCRAGRALDDARPKAVPYLEHDPQRRICIAPDENVTAKLELARARVSEYTLRGVRNHLRAICRTYGDLVHRLEGDLEQRTQSIVRKLSHPPPTRSAELALERWPGTRSA